MAAKIRALVKPELLKWGRTSAGLSLEAAAKKAAVTVARLQEWEEGLRSPTLTQLRKLATAYRRPLAVFYLPEPPQGFDALKDYRRFPGEVAGIETPELRAEIRRAHYRREVALELCSLLEELPPAFDLRSALDEDPEGAGVRMRQWLGIKNGWGGSTSLPTKHLTLGARCSNTRECLCFRRLMFRQMKSAASV